MITAEMPHVSISCERIAYGTVEGEHAVGDDVQQHARVTTTLQFCRTLSGG